MITDKLFAITVLSLGAFFFILDILQTGYLEKRMKMAGICAGIVLFTAVAVSIVIGVI